MDTTNITPEKKDESSVNNPAAVSVAPVIENNTEMVSTNKRLFLFGLGGFVLLAVVIVFCVTLFRVYGGVKTDKFTVTVAEILRLPAMKVNGERILYSDYAEDLAAIKKMRDYDLQTGGPSATLTDDKMSEQVLLRLANNVLVGQAAKQYDLKVEQKDVDAIKTEILKQFKTEADADKEIMNRYGWNLKTYMDKVVVSYLLQQKLAESLTADAKLRGDVLNKATDVLNKIKAGDDFAKLAVEYSEDVGSAAKGGDLDWFAKGQMVPQFEKAVFALKKGEVAPELVETEYGFHIVRVDDKKTVKGVEQVRARHILFRFASFEKLLSEMAKNAVTHIYIKVSDPFEAFRKTLTAVQDETATTTAE